MAYAENTTTTVTVERSRSEIERILARYGATSFAYGWDADRALVQFSARDRQIRFVLDLPARDDRSVTHVVAGGRGTVKRSPAQAEKAWEQICRQRWRALALVIKAKLEAVESNIVTFEDEFAMWMVLPDGSTVKDHALPAVDAAYRSGHMPTSLLALPAGSGPGSSS